MLFVSVGIVVFGGFRFGIFGWGGDVWMRGFGWGCFRICGYCVFVFINVKICFVIF